MIVESKLWSNSFTLSTTKICWQNELVRFLNAGDSSTALFPHFFPFFKNSSFPLPPSWPFYICKYYLYKFLDFFFLDFFRLLVYLKPSLRQFLSFNSFRSSFTIPFLILLPFSPHPPPFQCQIQFAKDKRSFSEFSFNYKFGRSIPKRQEELAEKKRLLKNRRHGNAGPCFRREGTDKECKRE